MSNNELLKTLKQEIEKISFEQLPIPILARAMLDKVFKDRLIKYPNQTLKDFGYDYGDTDIYILKDTANLKHVIIPNSPLDNNQFLHYKKSEKYFNKHSDNACDKKCHITSYTFVECASLPTCV